tara:strand:- start:4 stop:312 length:309 start_codon:yes stop_codon:yes gene_type:complete
MKVLHFVDTAGSDEHFFPAANMTMIEVQNNTSVRVYFSNSGDITDHEIDITVDTNKADETALKMAEYMTAGNVANGGVAKFIARTAPLEDASAVAYSIGADA